MTGSFPDTKASRYEPKGFLMEILDGRSIPINSIFLGLRYALACRPRRCS